MRVNMDSSIASDPRFKLMARQLKVDWKQVIGSAFLVWLACYERRSERLPAAEIDVAAELDGFADALATVGLAHSSTGGEMTVHGVAERIEFLQAQAERGAKGGNAKAKRDLANAKQTLSKRHSKRRATAMTNTLTLTPAPDLPLTPAPDPHIVGQGRQRVTAAQVESDPFLSELFGFRTECTEVLAAMAATRKTGMTSALVERTAKELAELLTANEGGCVQGCRIVLAKPDFDWNSEPTSILRYIRKCADRHQPGNGHSTGNPRPFRDPENVSAAELREMADKAREAENET